MNEPARPILVIYFTKTLELVEWSDGTWTMGPRTTIEETT